MNKDLEELRGSVQRLRADLMATNMALQCVLTCMTPDQQRQALTALAELSVLQEQFVAARPTPAEREAARPILQAVERQYQALQGAHKMRMAKVDGTTRPAP